MQEAFQKTIAVIVDQAEQLLEEKQIDGARQIDYVAIFPQSQIQYESLMATLGKIGQPVREVPTGTVFKLKEPIETSFGQVDLVRIRIFDPKKEQMGYVDYRILDYQLFKETYLEADAVEVTYNAEGTEMLTAQNENVIVYFPQIPLGQEIEDLTPF